MDNKFEILNKFVSGRKLSDEEFSELRSLFSNPAREHTVEMWLEAKWKLAPGTDVEVDYETLQRKIQAYERSRSLKYRIINSPGFQTYRRMAAVLLIPLLVVSGLLITRAFDPVKTYTAEAPWGEKARLILPDGSRILLNAGSRIRYGSDFDRRNRRLELDGEAYFEVCKNKGKPFVVSTPYLDVRVTGTKFNVNAYSEEKSVVTSLVEGSVRIKTRNGKTYHLTPGQSLALDKDTEKTVFRELNQDVTLAWCENRLIFADDDIVSLARKIEKWYGVKVSYDPAQFGNSTFTVRLMEGERLGNLMDIIETALDAECSMQADTLIIRRRK